MPGRALIAWTAIFGLYVQLLAAALCFAASTPGGLAGAAGTPICHGAAPGGAGDGPDRPAHAAGPCPFCSLHVHGGLPPAPPPQFAGQPVAVGDPIAAPRLAEPPLSRRLTDAAPRGPPPIG